MPTWLPAALMTQLIAVFFAPPIFLPIHEVKRHLFISDLWCWTWVTMALFSLLSKPPSRRFLKIFFVIVFVFIATYIHGYFRIPFSRVVNERLYLHFQEHDPFQAFRELIVMLRFLSWVLAGLIVTHFFTTFPKEAKKALLPLQKTACICLVISSFLVFIAKVFPSFAILLGKIYGYNPNYAFWIGRAYGVFQSPVEAGIALTLGAMGIALLSPASKKVIYWNIITVTFSVLAAALTKTFTPFLALALTLVLVRLRLKGVVFIFFIAIAAFVLVPPHTLNKIFFMKLEDLQYRTWVWQAFFEGSLLRWDIFLFGFGFTTYYLDSSYLWILNRAGLLGFLLTLGSLTNFLYGRWKKFDYSTKFFIIFVGLSATVLDLIIFRHVVMIFITFLLPCFLVQLKKS